MKTRNNKHLVLLSLGANLGNRNETILNAINMMESADILNHITVSSFYETEPYGIKEQPWFLNCCISGFTDYNAMFLIYFCKSIEYLLGRENRKKWHEREIDIDILLCGDEVIDTKFLTIPHKFIAKRKFVMVPAAEICGEMIHPVLNKTISELLYECDDDSIIKKIMEIN